MSLFCYAILCVYYSFAIILKRGTGCFALNVLQMSCYSTCPVAIPKDTICWSTVCDCGIFLS